MVAVVKSNKIRICIDPRDLNKAILREHYPMMTIEDVVAGMAQAKVFSLLNTTSGYWQVKLDEASSKLCTFNTTMENTASQGYHLPQSLPPKCFSTACQNRLKILKV